VAEVHLSDAAEADLEEIGDYLAAESPAAAISVVARLRASCIGLTSSPERHARVPRFEHRDVRRVVMAPYVVFFRIELENITVLRILHGARDYDGLIFPNDTAD
jgi:toxin ParE1/3/4